ncbi:MAG: glutathione S-transferase family protein [Actinomycetota bacterium]|jgi:glutathione S-transferase
MSAETVSFYGHWICPFATRVAFALAQRGVEYDTVNVPPLAVRGPHFVLPPEFIANSPRLEIPMLRIGLDYLADSIPILEWMEQRITDSPLLPSDESNRTEVRQRMAQIDQLVFRPMIGIYYGHDPDRIAQSGAALSAALAEIAQWPQQSDWLVGSEPTLAEAILVPLYVRLEGLRALGFSDPLPQAIERHRQRCSELDGWAAVKWTDDEATEFVGRFMAYRRKQNAST